MSFPARGGFAERFFNPVPASGHYVELYITATGGCSGLAIQDHIAAVRYVATNVCNVAFQFASGLRPILLTRMGPLRVFAIEGNGHSIFFFVCMWK